jgi:cardiolipin synthase
MSWSWLPNAITVLRLLAAPPLAWLILHGYNGYALAIGMVAGGSDALDGMLAKRMHWQSRIGGLLDPIADKLMLMCSTLALAATGPVPFWFAALVVTRDLVIVAGAVAYHNLVERLSAEPTRLSKATTFAQIMLVVIALAGNQWPSQVPGALFLAWLWGTSALTVASGADYVITWGGKARTILRARRERS